MIKIKFFKFFLKLLLTFILTTTVTFISVTRGGDDDEEAEEEEKIDNFEIPRRTIFANYDAIWEAILKETANYPYAYLNKSEGIIKTRWIDNTEEENALLTDAEIPYHASRVKLTFLIKWSVLKKDDPFAHKTPPPYPPYDNLDNIPFAEVTLYKRHQVLRSPLSNPQLDTAWESIATNNTLEKIILYRIQHRLNIQRHLGSLPYLLLRTPLPLPHFEKMKTVRSQVKTLVPYELKNYPRQNYQTSLTLREERPRLWYHGIHLGGQSTSYSVYDKGLNVAAKSYTTQQFLPQLTLESSILLENSWYFSLNTQLLQVPLSNNNTGTWVSANFLTQYGAIPLVVGMNLTYFPMEFISYTTSGIYIYNILPTPLLGLRFSYPTQVSPRRKWQLYAQILGSVPIFVLDFSGRIRNVINVKGYKVESSLGFHHFLTGNRNYHFNWGLEGFLTYQLLKYNYSYIESWKPVASYNTTLLGTGIKLTTQFNF